MIIFIVNNINIKLFKLEIYVKNCDKRIKKNYFIKKIFIEKNVE